ncbi:THAP domain-containing protein 7 isoform X2 [Nannospalax galili]|uniref:THAP domain-containing protein 7 isoform X2 n=1 Tax=Nannospalax galili TaxID=1026970 RepID=UPI00111BD4FD|nr:THAP domain-containing protein 7 isoform X2 [Nannospalax galili]
MQQPGRVFFAGYQLTRSPEPHSPAHNRSIPRPRPGPALVYTNEPRRQQYYPERPPSIRYPPTRRSSGSAPRGDHGSLPLSLCYQLPPRSTYRGTLAAQQWQGYAATLLRRRLLHTGYARDSQPRHLLPQVSARAWWLAVLPCAGIGVASTLGRTGDGAFLRLPKKDNPRRGLWLANCQRLDPSGQGLWDPASEYIYFCSKHFEENCFELVGISGYHRLKEGAVPTIFESFSKLRRTAKTKGHGYPPGLPDVSRLRRCRKRCSEGQGPTTPFSSPPPPDVICFPVEEASAPATLPASPAVRLEPGLSNPFSDLLDPLGAQADEAGCSAQPSPERQPSPLEPRPVSPSAYMLRLPPPAGAYIQNEHSYQVGSALLWKRRAESALDALDKAQRQLQACKRREQRLRLRLTKLQQERAREKRAQADARQTLKEHVQDFAMQLSNSMA